MEVSKWQTSLKIENDEILCKIDTGAQANVMPHHIFQRVCGGQQLEKTSLWWSAAREDQCSVMSVWR